MNATENPYTILGVAEDADEATIKKAYRKAAMQNHPDKQSTDEDVKLATERFAKIADAYSLLNDPVRRYDWRQANESRSRSSSSAPKRPSVPTPTSTATKSPAPSPQVHRRSFGPSQSRRSSDTSSVCSTGTRSSVRSNSSTGRRKSRVSIGRSSPQPSKSGRRAPSNLPVRESVRKPIRRTTSLGANMPKARNNIFETSVRSPVKPKRPSRNSSFNGKLPNTTASTKTKKSKTVPASEKGRKKTRTPSGSASAQGRRIRRVS